MTGMTVKKVMSRRHTLKLHVHSCFIKLSPADCFFILKASHKAIVRALYDFKACGPQEIDIREGDILRLYSHDCVEGWVLVSTVDDSDRPGSVGFVPSIYVEVRCSDS